MRAGNSGMMVMVMVMALTGRAAPALGQSVGDERVLSFAAELVMAPDGTLQVTERIRVRSAGSKIKHGIYRDLPTVKTAGLWRRTFAYQVASVLRNGAPERFAVLEDSALIRVIIGDENVLLPPGEHLYELRYQAPHQVRFLADHDELTWDVNGGSWPLEFDRVSWTLRLPGQAHERIIDLRASVGYDNEAASPVTHQATAAGLLVETNRKLSAREGLTVTVTWPKGAVIAPAPRARSLRLVRDNAPTVVALLGTFLVLVYFAVVRRRLSRPDAPLDPGLVTEPPRGLSPAEARAALDLTGDDRALTATLVQLAIKGALTIHDDKGNFTVVRASAVPANLTEEERSVLSALWPAGTDPLPVSRANVSLLRDAQEALAKSVSASKRAWVASIKPYARAGAALSAAVVFITLLILQYPAVGSAVMWTVVAGGMAAAWGFGCTLMLGTLGQAWADVRKHPSRAPGALFFTVFMSAWVFGPILMLVAASQGHLLSYVPLMLCALLMGVTYWRFVRHYRRRSALGHEVAAEVSAYRRYLTRRGPVASSGSGDGSPDDPHLPYALALDAWDVAGPRSGDDTSLTFGTRSSARPTWYQTEGGAQGAGPAQFFHNISTAFAAAVATATVYRSSGRSSGYSSRSSSSSSSGSSGGGGGGGGGGW